MEKQLFRKISAVKNFSFSISVCSVKVSFWKRSHSEKKSAAKSGYFEKGENSSCSEKYLLRKCNCCVEVVTLKKCEKYNLSINKVVLKKSLHMREGKSLFEKKKSTEIRLVTTFNWNYFPERFPHPGKYLYEIPHEYWLKPTEKKIIILCLCYTIFINF